MARSNKTKPAKPAETELKILLFDVESFANKSYTWGKYEQDVIAFIEPKMICSIAWQWYPEKKTYILALPDMPGYNPNKRTNKALIKAFKREMNKADIVIGHNVRRFDDRRIRTELLKHKLGPTTDHRTVDTLTVLRTYFDFNSNKLGDVCEELGIGKKVKHPGFPMWIACERGDDRAWKKMKQYNGADVSRLLRPLYERIRPFMKNHPNMNVLKQKTDRCPTCSGIRLKRNGWTLNKWGKTMRWRCLSRLCGKTFAGAFVKGGWRMG